MKKPQIKPFINSITPLPFDENGKFIGLTNEQIKKIVQETANYPNIRKIISNLASK